MKVERWTGRVLEGPLEDVYVYSAPVRLWHWLTVLCMLVLVPTGWLIGNIDATVICERPKITPHAEAMRARTLANSCGLRYTTSLPGSRSDTAPPEVLRPNSVPCGPRSTSIRSRSTICASTRAASAASPRA